MSVKAAEPDAELDAVPEPVCVKLGVCVRVKDGVCEGDCVLVPVNVELGVTVMAAVPVTVTADLGQGRVAGEGRAEAAATVGCLPGALLPRLPRRPSLALGLGRLASGRPS